MQKIITKLKSQKRSLWLLQFDSTKDSNYMNWENTTENIVRMAFSGDKNIHVNQFKKIISSSTSIYSFHDTKKFKLDMNNYIQSCIQELELVEEMNNKKFTSKWWNTSIKLTQKNKQTNNQTINIWKVFDKIIEEIETNEPDPEKVEEAKEKIGILQDELKKEKPVRSKVKTWVEWILNFSRDAFIQCVPILLEKFGWL